MGSTPAAERTVFGRGKQDAPAPEPQSVEPFVDGDFRAEWAPRPVGKRGRTRPMVRLTAGGADADVHGGELRGLVHGRQAIADSDTLPRTFLCRPTAAAPTSLASDAVAGLPADSLALLVDPVTDPPRAVLDADAIGRFTTWLDALPF